MLLWMGFLLLGLFALRDGTDVLAGFEVGLSLGAGVVVLVLYPAFLNSHEKRIAALEQSQRTGADSPGA